MKKYKEYLRNLQKMNYSNKGNRTLFESILPTEVLSTLKEYINQHLNCVLIGGLALSYYVKPRYTTDIDVLFLSTEDIPDTIDNFKRHRKSVFQHNKTHVEVEVLVSKTINTSQEIINKVFETSILVDGIMVASPAGLVALKLGRFNLQDQADIEALKKYTKIDLSDFNLTEELLKKFESI